MNRTWERCVAVLDGGPHAITRALELADPLDIALPTRAREAGR